LKPVALFILISTAEPAIAQSKRGISKGNIEAKVNEIFLENSVYVMSVEPIMNSEMEKNYKIKIHNGSKKQVVALNLWLNFNVKSNNVYDGGRSNCYLSKKIKLPINAKSNRTYILTDLQYKVECDNIPSIEVTTIVYSDGTFDDFKTEFDRHIDKTAEKEKIRGKLLKQGQ
jgi:hypothetical protein